MSSTTAHVGAPLLEVRDLTVHFPTPDGLVRAVDGLSYELNEGETLGIVGESGSGKSVSCLTMLGLTNRDAARISGHVTYGETELLSASSSELQRVRGNEISMIFQDPFAALHPMFRIGDQLVEAVRAHASVSKREARERAAELLDRVGMANPRARMSEYPHEYSGGMRQRVMIAMALINDPRVLIADEPTTALDVTVQAQILELIEEIKEERRLGVILITHDLAIVDDVAESVLVMYAGRAVEHGPTREVFSEPKHPYTWGLLDSMPRLDERDRDLRAIDGQPPSLIFVPSGCAFHPRCSYELSQCPTERPDLTSSGEHRVACHLGVDERRRYRAGRDVRDRAASSQ